MVQIPIPDTDKSIYCKPPTVTAQTSPQNFRQQIFSTHTLPHTRIRSTRKLMTERFIWPNINKDGQLWCRECMECQRFKVQRHTKSALRDFKVPPECFQHVHIDIVGPLPSYQGFRYLLTMICRFSRPVEALLMTDQSNETVAKDMISTWISRFGIPQRITSDQGGQFGSQFFSSLSKYFDFQKSRTAAYHPQSNRLIKRQHGIKKKKQILGRRFTFASSWITLGTDIRYRTLFSLVSLWKSPLLTRRIRHHAPYVVSVA
ncbi:Retrovirus-related Pol polyprotein like [Argiope bruennichi]|uniref:RNA-directed DNA polymerase n=1 Tax=Argiope bruennichi TaxID=94029 RepID=A0A8T0FZ35_ARGBR|nr:Retrovirus-related Pol polyprotein like [Argiope bruennichi]